MLSNYFKISIRNIKLNPSTFFINVFGLSLGLSAFFLILLWVQDEINVNNHLQNRDDIVQIMEHQAYSDNIMTTTSTPGILAEALMDEIPEIEKAAGYTWSDNQLVSVGDKHLKYFRRFAGKEFLSIYQIPILKGSAETALTNPTSVAISRKVAESLFSSIDEAIGNQITVSNADVYTITAIFENIPVNSSLQFDFLLPFSLFLANNDWATSWGNNGPSTIARLSKGVSLQELNIKIVDFIKQRNENSNVELFAYPYHKTYLYGSFINGFESGGRIVYVRLFSIVAIFVLIIACINFMNLATARSVKRAREVGIRKSLGANNSALIIQFLVESLLTAFIAGLIALFLIFIMTSPFNSITSKNVSLNLLDPTVWILFFGITFVTGLLAGSYPAFYLSSFEPARVLKGSVKSRFGEIFIRKGLVTLQFILSFILIVCTLVVSKQINFIQNKDLGFDKEQLISVTLDGNLSTQFDSFKQELVKRSSIESVSRSSTRFTSRNSNFGNLRFRDKRFQILVENIRTDYDFIETAKIKLKFGRTFSPDFPNDTNRIVVNEALTRMIGLENPVGQTVNFWNADWEIVGVVEDFHFQSVHNQIAPTVLFYNTAFTWTALIRSKPGDLQETIKDITEVAKAVNPLYPLDYHFLDESIEKLYASEKRISELSRYFALFAILISCLGLFGLSLFTAEQRTKEIGIRKVMGASVFNLVMLLTKEFTIIIVVSIILAIPLSLFILNDWLNTFAFHIGLSIELFALAAVLSLLLGWLTVSYQSFKAASSDPIKSLRYE